jgi:uncharacterized protein (TIGR02246 family)
MTTDERALSQIVAKLEEAWNAGDSAAFASDFTDDASFIHIHGGRLDGRPATGRFLTPSTRAATTITCSKGFGLFAPTLPLSSSRRA